MPSGLGAEQTPNQCDLDLDRAVLAVGGSRLEKLQDSVAISHVVIVMRIQPPIRLALLTSARMVPPFALFEFIAPQFRIPLRANNAKSGTCVADATERSQLGVAEAAKRSQLALLPSVLPCS